MYHLVCFGLLIGWLISALVNGTSVDSILIAAGLFAIAGSIPFISNNK